MLETGHPLHAFDLGKISGRHPRAPRGWPENMTTLDGVDRPLREGDIVSPTTKGTWLAGVIGGGAGCPPRRRPCSEAATFDPRAVRAAKAPGLHSRRRTASSEASTNLPHASARAAARGAPGRLGRGGQAHRSPTSARRGAQGDAVDGRPATPRGLRHSLGRGREASAVGRDPAEGRRRPDDRHHGATFRPDVAIERTSSRSCACTATTRPPPAGGQPRAATSRGRCGPRARHAGAGGLHGRRPRAFAPRAWLLALGGGRKDHPLADGIVVRTPSRPTTGDAHVVAARPGRGGEAQRRARPGRRRALRGRARRAPASAGRDARTPHEPVRTGAIWVGHWRGLAQAPASRWTSRRQARGRPARALGVAAPCSGAPGDLLHPARRRHLRRRARPSGSTATGPPPFARAGPGRGALSGVALDGVAGAGRPCAARPAATPRRRGTSRSGLTGRHGRRAARPGRRRRPLLRS